MRPRGRRVRRAARSPGRRSGDDPEPAPLLGARIAGGVS
jgi:hypothetical protein